jgi:hypothetical protein
MSFIAIKSHPFLRGSSFGAKEHLMVALHLVIIALAHAAAHQAVARRLVGV